MANSRVDERKCCLAGIFLQRQQEEKSASRSLRCILCRTFHPDHATMGLDHPFDDRQPHACSLSLKLVFAGGVVPDIPDLVKFIEYFQLFIGINADAAVPHFYLHETFTPHLLIESLIKAEKQLLLICEHGAV